jgi:hypothetical protein
MEADQKTPPDERGPTAGGATAAQLALSKDVGASRGIDEKLCISSATGMSALSIPIATRPGPTSAGALAATVQFGPFTFYALSSRSAANGKLLLDVDYGGLTANSSSGDPRTFNLAVKELTSGNTEDFLGVALDNSKSNFVLRYRPGSQQFPVRAVGN